MKLLENTILFGIKVVAAVAAAVHCAARQGRIQIKISPSVQNNAISYTKRLI